MTIQQFIQSTGFTARDAFAATRMYKGQEKTAAQWNKELKDKFVYNFVETKNRKRDSNKNKD